MSEFNPSLRYLESEKKETDQEETFQSNLYVKTSSMAFFILLGAFFKQILLALTEISSTLMKMGEEKKSLLCGDLNMLFTSPL